MSSPNIDKDKADLASNDCISNDEKLQEKKDNGVKANAKNEIDLNKENHLLNKFFMLLTAICFLGTAYFVIDYNNYWNKFIDFKPEDYELPKVTDFILTIKCLPIIILAKIVCERYLSTLMYNFVLAEKYKDPLNEENFRLGLIYKKKLATNVFKIIWYTGIVTFGYFVFKDMPFFPYELLGNGDMEALFEKGDPQYLFFDKPAYFDFYYLASLAFVLTDLIWLLFIYEKRTDFHLMLLHHSVTISLVTFSYLFNLSQIGIIVFFLHDAIDILVYALRTVLNSNFSEPFKIAFSAVFLISYIYFRLYIFGKLIIVCYFGGIQWTAYHTLLWLFKCFLYTMHLYWVYEIIIRFCYLKTVDVGKEGTKKNK